MKKKEKLFLGGEINLSELDVDVQKKKELRGKSSFLASLRGIH